MVLTGRSFGELLVKDGVISKEQLEEALRVQKQTDQCISRVMIDMNLITELQKINYYKKKMGIRVVDLDKQEVDLKVLKLISRTTAEKHHLIPFQMEGGNLLIAMEDPSDIILIDNIEHQCGYQVIPVLSTIAGIDKMIKIYSEQMIDDSVGVLAERSIGFKAFKALFTLLVLLLPLGVLVGVLQKSESIKNFFMQEINGFDRFIYIFCFWALWAIVVFYINSFIFKEKRII